jgi:hypothetical protein
VWHGFMFLLQVYHSSAENRTHSRKVATQPIRTQFRKGDCWVRQGPQSAAEHCQFPTSRDESAASLVTSFGHIENLPNDRLSFDSNGVESWAVS